MYQLVVAAVVMCYSSGHVNRGKEGSAGSSHLEHCSLSFFQLALSSLRESRLGKGKEGGVFKGCRVGS